MTTLVILASIIFLILIALQVHKISELTSKIKGEEVVRQNTTRWNGAAMLVFVTLFLVGVIASTMYYKNYMLGYGPLKAASLHGADIEFLFNVTLFFTGIVFVLTNIALFYFAWKYQERPGRKASFISHNNRLEVIWTAIPAVVMTILVVGGLSVWNDTMSDVDPTEDFMEIEATGYQFAWAIRYPGVDKKLGDKNFKKITATNVVGMDWSDKRNMDDFLPTGDLLIPKGKKIRVRITARDVLHDFYLPHFKVKMDAIPGLPTYFVFTPTKTTSEYRQELSKYAEYNVPFDPKEPNGPKVWQKFEYELACAELCGKGHFSMRRVVRVVEQAEYDAWVKAQKSFYMESIKGTPEDPFTGALSGPADPKVRAEEFGSLIETAIKDTSARVINLSSLVFETGSAKIAADSQSELENMLAALKLYPKMSVQIGGHTDNVGIADKNMTLSQQRAKAVVDYLSSKGIAAARLKAAGFGDTKPVADNATEDGKAKNRRTEFTIITI